MSDLKTRAWRKAVGIVQSCTVHYPEQDCPEDAEVRALCEKWGYGAVMSRASALWARKDPIGCLTTGPCKVTVDEAISAIKGAALEKSKVREGGRRGG